MHMFVYMVHIMYIGDYRCRQYSELIVVVIS